MRKTIKIKKVAFKFPTVMLIDDNELDNFINQKVIEINSFSEKIYVNSSGVSALEFLKNLCVNQALLNEARPSVIFVDINMPFMDGFQFIEQFYKLPQELSKNSKVVILTSSFNPADKEIAGKINKDIIFLNKPLTPESLELIS
ncbi:MAG: response regulator [Bacteroidota bacterium]|nr:response regulator [Bacteroidota bacterium]